MSRGKDLRGSALSDDGLSISGVRFRFENRAKQKIMLPALEIPLTTVKHAVKKEVEAEMRVILNPGGITKPADVEAITGEKIFLLKPNEHEAKILTGVSIEDFQSAEIAAKILIEKGIQNILITHGDRGGLSVQPGNQPLDPRAGGKRFGRS